MYYISVVINTGYCQLLNKNNIIMIMINIFLNIFLVSGDSLLVSSPLLGEFWVIFIMRVRTFGFHVRSCWFVDVQGGVRSYYA